METIRKLWLESLVSLDLAPRAGKADFGVKKKKKENKMVKEK